MLSSFFFKVSLLPTDIIFLQSVITSSHFCDFSAIVSSTVSSLTYCLYALEYMDGIADLYYLLFSNDTFQMLKVYLKRLNYLILLKFLVSLHRSHSLKHGTREQEKRTLRNLFCRVYNIYPSLSAFSHCILSYAEGMPAFRVCTQ